MNMKIPCELYIMDKDRVRGELIGTFEDIEAAQAYIKDVCTKIPFPYMDNSRFRIVRLSNDPKDEKRILPCPVCNNEIFTVSQFPDIDGYAKITCRKCGLTVNAKAVDEHYTKTCGDLYRKRPAKAAVDVVIELWNAMAKNY